ncbi:hypothetical protein B0H10DRAFT_1845514, partial [Mycena sp. CBHHK59/15]
IDIVTGMRIHAGSYTLPAGVGGIRSSQTGLVGWYPWNSVVPPKNCTGLPWH